MYVDKSPEFWCGWALAYYQWYSGKSFHSILSAVGLSEIMAMYPLYHEMDVAMFVDEIERIQLLEQRQRDINKAQAMTLYKLSHALHCKMGDLMEL